MPSTLSIRRIREEDIESYANGSVFPSASNVNLPNFNRNGQNVAEHPVQTESHQRCRSQSFKTKCWSAISRSTSQTDLSTICGSLETNSSRSTGGARKSSTTDSAGSFLRDSYRWIWIRCSHFKRCWSCPGTITSLERTEHGTISSVAASHLLPGDSRQRSWSLRSSRA